MRRAWQRTQNARCWSHAIDGRGGVLSPGVLDSPTINQEHAIEQIRGVLLVRIREQNGDYLGLEICNHLRKAACKCRREALEGFVEQ